MDDRDKKSIKNLLKEDVPLALIDCLSTRGYDFSGDNLKSDEQTLILSGTNEIDSEYKHNKKIIISQKINDDLLFDSNGSAYINEKFLQTKISKVFLERFLGGDASLALENLNLNVLKAHTFKITYMFSSGHYVDVISKFASDHKFDFYKVKKYFSQLMDFFFFLKQKGVVHYPVEIDYFATEEFMAIQCYTDIKNQEMVKDLRLSLTVSDDDSLEKGTLRKCLNYTDCLDVYTLEKSSRLVVAGVWINSRVLEIDFPSFFLNNIKNFSNYDIKSDNIPKVEVNNLRESIEDDVLMTQPEKRSPNNDDELDELDEIFNSESDKLKEKVISYIQEMGKEKIENLKSKEELEELLVGEFGTSIKIYGDEFWNNLKGHENQVKRHDDSVLENDKILISTSSPTSESNQDILPLPQIDDLDILAGESDTVLDKDKSGKVETSHFELDNKRLLSQVEVLENRLASVASTVDKKIQTDLDNKDSQLNVLFDKNKQIIENLEKSLKENDRINQELTQLKKAKPVAISKVENQNDDKKLKSQLQEYKAKSMQFEQKNKILANKIQTFEKAKKLRESREMFSKDPAMDKKVKNLENAVGKLKIIDRKNQEEIEGHKKDNMTLKSEVLELKTQLEQSIKKLDPTG